MEKVKFVKGDSVKFTFEFFKPQLEALGWKVDGEVAEETEEKAVDKKAK